MHQMYAEQRRRSGYSRKTKKIEVSVSANRVMWATIISQWTKRVWGGFITRKHETVERWKYCDRYKHGIYMMSKWWNLKLEMLTTLLICSFERQAEGGNLGNSRHFPSIYHVLSGAWANNLIRSGHSAQQWPSLSCMKWKECHGLHTGHVIQFSPEKTAMPVLLI
jgi:hypothetical protein